MPSVKEGWGLTIMEAALHETPSVAFRFAGGTQDSICDDETGLLADSYEEFRESVADLLSDTTWREHMGKAARAYAETFSWETTGAAVEKILQAAVSSHRTWSRSTAAGPGGSQPRGDQRISRRK
jgi:glycosyltransferase involved in cell wall biosynthesis